MKYKKYFENDPEKIIHVDDSKIDIDDFDIEKKFNNDEDSEGIFIYLIF
jgi:hypothetical protein